MNDYCYCKDGVSLDIGPIPGTSTLFIGFFLFNGWIYITCFC